MDSTCLIFFKPYGIADRLLLASLSRQHFLVWAIPTFLIRNIQFLPLYVKTYPAEHKMLCAISVPRTSRHTMSECIQNKVANQLLALLGIGWKSKNDNILSTNREPSNLSKYETDFEHANSELADNMYADTVNKIAIIKMSSMNLV